MPCPRVRTPLPREEASSHSAAYSSVLRATMRMHQSTQYSIHACEVHAYVRSCRPHGPRTPTCAQIISLINHQRSVVILQPLACRCRPVLGGTLTGDVAQHLWNQLITRVGVAVALAMADGGVCMISGLQLIFLQVYYAPKPPYVALSPLLLSTHHTTGVHGPYPTL